MSLPWIKLYCEILEDPKMGKMPEWLFGRCIKLFLMAGREGKDGMLPPVEDMLWTLRLDDEQKLTQTLQELAEVGVTCQADDGSGRWLIVNFSKRQSLSDGAERTRKYREKMKKKSDNVTSQVTSPISTSISPLPLNSESFSEGEGVGGGKFTPAETANARSAFENSGGVRQCEKLYQQVTGQFSIPSAAMGQALQDLQTILDHYGKDWDLAVKDGKQIFATWCGTTGKSGKYYSKVNVGWLGKWLEKIAPMPDNPDPTSIAAISAQIRRDMMEARNDN